MDQEIPQELVEAGRGYETLFVPALFEQWTGHIIDGARIRDGSHVLDITCGTGVLARNALWINICIFILEALAGILVYSTTLLAESVVIFKLTY